MNICEKCGREVPDNAYNSRHEDCYVPKSGGTKSETLKKVYKNAQAHRQASKNTSIYGD